MDYIQEELMRQREALAGLLLGGALPRGGDGGRSSGHAAADTPAAALAAVSAAAFSGRGQGNRPTEGGSLSAGSGRSAVFGIPEAGGRTEAAGETAGSRETVSSRETAGSRETAESLRQSRKSGRLTGTIPPEPADVWRGAETPDRREARRSGGSAVLERTVTEFIRTEGSVSVPGAETLSRAFQRDARRYDGGFSLY